MRYREIYCCGCKKVVEARLTNGSEIHPENNGLKNMPYWICDTCGNHVGCHHKTKNDTKPLGVIATKKIRFLRRSIHQMIDPIWKTNKMTRNQVYSYMSVRLGYRFHSAKIKSKEEGEKALKIAKQLFLDSIDQKRKVSKSRKSNVY